MRNRRKSLLLALAGSMVALTISLPASAAVNCRVSLVSLWDTGYQLRVDFTNRGPEPVSDWYGILRFNDMETGIRSYWNATLSGIGTEKVVTPPPWAKTLNVGQTLSVGLLMNVVNIVDIPTCEVVERNAPTSTTTTTTTRPPTTTTTLLPTTTTTTTTLPPTTTTTRPLTTTSTRPEYSVSCSISRSSVWSDGYQIDVTVKNEEMAAITGWAVNVLFSEPPQITGSWNANLTVDGNRATARNVSWNGYLGSKQTTTFGIQGSYDGSFVIPQCGGLVS